MLNIENEFRQPLSIDAAPQGSACEWCGKPAKHQFIVLGGTNHNESGLFCRTCGEAFVCAVASSLCREVTVICWISWLLTTFGAFCQLVLFQESIEVILTKDDQ